MDWGERLGWRRRNRSQATRSTNSDLRARTSQHIRGPVPESGGVSVLIIGLFAFGKTSIRQFNGCRGWQFKPSVIHSVLQARGEIRDFPAVDGELQLYLVSLENRASSKAHDFENSENNFR